MGKSSGETSLGSSFRGDGSRRGSDTFLGERAPNLMGNYWKLLESLGSWRMSDFGGKWWRATNKKVSKVEIFGGSERIA